jgi:hypothetical protein
MASMTGAGGLCNSPVKGIVQAVHGISPHSFQRQQYTEETISQQQQNRAALATLGHGPS